MNVKCLDVHIKVSAADKLQLQENANKLGLNISQLIRILTLIEPKDILDVYDKNVIVVNNKNELKKLEKEINKIGVNVNQCAKAINTVVRFYRMNNDLINDEMKQVFNSVTEKALKNLCTNIQELKTKVTETEEKLVLKRKAGC